MTADAFSNILFRLGYGSQAPIEATDYPLTRMTDNYALLNSLYRNNWIVQNVVEIIPSDMLREWFKLTGSATPEELAAFERVCRTTNLRNALKTGLMWGRLYGGAAGLILIKGQDDLSAPLDISTILPGTYQGLYILDRWTGITPDMELVNDPADVDFNLPMWYNITDARGRTVAQVHHSRIVRFTGRDLPFIEAGAELYWGASEIESLYDDLKKHDNVSHNMANLTFRANMDVMTVQNLDQLLSVGGAQQQKRFWDTMQAQSVIRSNFGVQLVNRDDTLTNTQYSFSGLKDIYDSMCLDISGASHIPATKLFGRAPAGMNATGESDMKNYYDYLDTLRESKLRPAIDRLLPVILMSAWGHIPDAVEVQFPPLWTPTAREVGEIARAKADTVIAAFQAGLLDQSAAMSELKKLSDETGMFGGITDEAIRNASGRTYQDVTSLKDPLAGISGAPLPEAGMAMDFNPNHDPENGQFAPGGGGGGTRKSSKKKPKQAKLGKKERQRVSSGILTDHPDFEPGSIHSYFFGDYYYQFVVEEPGSYGFTRRVKITGNQSEIDRLEKRHVR